MRIPQVGTSVTRIQDFAATGAEPALIQNFGAGMQQAGSDAVRLGSQLVMQQARFNHLQNVAEATAKANEAREEIASVVGEYALLEADAAAKGHQTYIEKLEETRNRYADQITNPVQRRMFMESMDPVVRNVRSDMEAHKRNQVKRYTESETLREIGHLSQDVSALAANLRGNVDEQDDDIAAKRFSQTIGRIRAKTDFLATLRGFAPDSLQRQQMHQEAADNIHSDIVTRMVRQDDSPAARRWLSRYGGDMSGMALSKVAGLVESATFKDETFAQARAITEAVSQAADEAARNGQLLTIEQQEVVAYRFLDEQQKATGMSVDRYDAVRDRLKNRFREMSDTQAADDSALVAAAKRWILDPQNQYRTFSDNPDLHSALLQRGLLDGLLPLQQRRQDISDPAAQVDAAAISNDQLVNTSLEDLANNFAVRLGSKEYTNLVERRRKLIDDMNGQSSDPDFRFEMSLRDETFEVARKHGLIPAKGDANEDSSRWTPQQKKDFHKLEVRVAQFIERAQRETKKRFTETQARDAFRAAMANVVEDAETNRNVPLIMLADDRLSVDDSQIRIRRSNGQVIRYSDYQPDEREQARQAYIRTHGVDPRSVRVADIVMTIEKARKEAESKGQTVQPIQSTEDTRRRRNSFDSLDYSLQRF